MFKKNLRLTWTWWWVVEFQTEVSIKFSYSFGSSAIWLQITGIVAHVPCGIYTMGCRWLSSHFRGICRFFFIFILAGKVRDNVLIFDRFVSRRNRFSKIKIKSNTTERQTRPSPPGSGPSDGRHLVRFTATVKVQYRWHPRPCRSLLSVG